MRVFAALLVACAAAAADEIELTNGDIILDCKITDVGDSYKVVKGGAARTISKLDVKRVEYKETSEDIYTKRAADLKDEDLDGHLALARFCKQRGLNAQAKKEFEKVVAINGDHEESRLALGHVKHDGKWMTEEDANKAKGLVRHKGRWMTPAERDLDIALDEQRELDKRLVAEVRRLVDRVSSSDEKKRAEAIDELSKFDDKYKVKPYLAVATLSSKHLRLFVAGELGRIKPDLGDQAWNATKTLARRAVWDEVEEVRAAALKSLIAIKHADTTIALTPFLEEESTTIRIRVEDALAHFEDLRAVPPLLSLLYKVVETLKWVEKYEKDFAAIVKNMIVTRDGRRIPLPENFRIAPEAFDKEGKRRLQEERQALIHSLNSVTGQVFGDDVAAWKGWYDRKKAEKK